MLALHAVDYKVDQEIHGQPFLVQDEIIEVWIGNVVAEIPLEKSQPGFVYHLGALRGFFLAQIIKGGYLFYPP